ncbi:retrovirus-related pol polyprotein from transposon TNT 1-94 [Tanacetum coccineum]
MHELILFYNGLEIPTQQILNSRGAIPSKNVAEYSQKLYNGTSRLRRGGYRAAALRFYQRNNVNPSYQERRQSMEDTLSKFMRESANRHKENSNLIKKSELRQMLPFITKEHSLKLRNPKSGNMSYGASVSIMPLLTYLNLGLGELAHTKLKVELADKTMKYPKGIAKNVLVGIEAVATACYTQNRSLIHTRHNKTPYELVHDKKHGLTFLRVFGALCYPTNDSEDLGKLQPTADIGIFLSEPMAPAQLGTGPPPLFLTLRQIKPPRVKRLVSSATAVQVPVISSGVATGSTIIEDNPFAHVDNDPFVNVFALELSSEASSSEDVSSAESTHVTQPHHHLGK